MAGPAPPADKAHRTTSQNPNAIAVGPLQTSERGSEDLREGRLHYIKREPGPPACCLRSRLDGQDNTSPKHRTAARS